MWCASMPFGIGTEVKEPVGRERKEEEGEDSYLGDSHKFAAYDMTVKWCCKGDKFSANAVIKKFLNYLSGRDGSGMKMKMYCDWTKVGRRHIRLKKVSDDAELHRDDEGDVVTFSTVLRVEDPVTEVTLSK